MSRRQWAQWSIGFSVGGLAAFAMFMAKAGARCPGEAVPGREWLLSVGSLVAGAIGFACFAVASVRGDEENPRAKHSVSWGFAAVACVPAFLYVPLDLHFVNQLRQVQSVIDITDCFGQA